MVILKVSDGSELLGVIDSGIGVSSKPIARPFNDKVLIPSATGAMIIPSNQASPDTAVAGVPVPALSSS